MTEYLTLTLTDLETLLAKNGCNCHFINPHKTRLILWKETINGTETYYLRIGVQKFISYPLKDKNKLNYWKFNPYLEQLTETKTKLAESWKEIKTEHLDPVSKFNQSQAQANYGKSDDVEPSMANSFAS